MTIELLQQDCRTALGTLPPRSVHCCVTSPPYYGLRDYGVAGQIGLEQTPDEYVAEIVGVMREVYRVLRDDGTLWLNLGDSYAGSGKGGNPPEHGSKQDRNRGSQTTGNLYVIGGTAREAAVTNVTRRTFDGIKAKDLIGIPWKVAFALRDDGWYLRQDIIWNKPNAMPESIEDRCTRSHEYIFMLSKSPRYYYDAEAIREPLAQSSMTRSARPPAPASNIIRKQDGTGDRRYVGFNERYFASGAAPSRGRNKRSVWSVTTKPFKGAHFATFPHDLIEPCILAGTPTGGDRTRPVLRRGHYRHGRRAQRQEQHRRRAQLRLCRNGEVTTRPTLRQSLRALPPRHGS